jgi:hypothetical protein
VTKKNIKILQVAIIIPFAIFWFSAGGYHFFDFLHKPTSEWQGKNYFIIFIIGSGIVSWIVQKKRNKIKHRIRETHQQTEQHVESTIKTSKNLNIPQESIDRLERSRKAYIWLFSIASLVILFAVFSFITTGIRAKAGVTFELIWLIFMVGILSTLVAALLQSLYDKEYSEIYISKVLSNIEGVKNASIIEKNPKNAIRKFLPGMPKGRIYSRSSTLILGTKQYNAEAVVIDIEKGGGENSTTVFRGIVANIDIESSDNTNIIALVSTSSSLGISGFFKKIVDDNSLNIDGRQLDKIELLSSDFKGLFNVYGDDQVNARKLLNPANIENILKLASHENLYALTIDQNHMIAAFEGDHIDIDLKPKNFLFKPRTNEGRIKNITNAVNQIQTTTKKLYDLVK